MSKIAKKNRTYTLMDVARLAGVSTATVARTIKAPNLVSVDTRSRVQRVLAETRYTPNPLAMGLASNRSNLVIIMMPGVASPLFADAIFAITRKLGEAGILGVMCLMSRDEAEMDRIVRDALARRPDAIILTGARPSKASESLIRAAGVTVIQTWDLPAQPFDLAIGFSQAKAGAAIANLLHERGRRRALVIGFPSVRFDERFDGFRKAWLKAGLEEPNLMIAPPEHGFLNGRVCFARHLAEGGKPDCVVCSSDLVGAGVLAHAMSIGLKVPKDLAVVGFGATDISAHTIPDLTTIEFDSAAIAHHAAQVIIGRSRGIEPRKKKIDVGFKLLVRGSV
jgi:LacI family transcriptional regulator, gluconate utilization system Gnt-I transcriptional repressor